ncbi:MAG: ATP-binding protein [candidate division FCPU426 bacterium]
MKTASLHEFQLFRVCLLLTFVAPLLFLPFEHIFVLPAFRWGIYGVIFFSVAYSAALWRWITTERYLPGVFLFLACHLAGDTLAVVFHSPACQVWAFFVVYTFISVFNVILVPWPSLLATSGLLYAVIAVFMLAPVSGFRQAAAHYEFWGLGFPFVLTAALVWFALVMIIGIAVTEASRRKERLLNHQVAEKNAEALQSRTQLETILRYLSVGVVIIDERLRPIYTNRVHFDFVPEGDDWRELPGSAFPLSFLREQFLSERGRQLLGSRQDIVGHRLEYTAPSGLSKILRYSFVAMPLASGAGNALRLVLFTEDITEEEVLREKLVHTNHLAEMGKMAAGLVHEINNPLQGIKLNLGLLELGIVEEDRRKQVFANLEEGISRINRIARSFLSFARQEKPRRQWTKLPVLLHDTLSMACNFKQLYDIHIQLECEEEIPAVSVDRSRMEIVFVNLLNNACDAMAGKGGQLKISCSHDATHVIVRFQDTGKGIRQEDLPRIFIPFFTTKERGFGTGLGLATSYGIVREHGGTMEVESREGAGATFIIRLPIVTQDEAGHA